MMADAFTELAERNDDYAEGRTLDVLKPSDVALTALDEVERIAYGEPSGHALGPSSPSPAVLRRLVHEKRGFLLLLASDHAAALAAYDRALEEAGDHTCGQVKVGLGQLLVEYVAAADSPARAEIADHTEHLGREASLLGNADISEIAERNAASMRSGIACLRDPMSHAATAPARPSACCLGSAVPATASRRSTPAAAPR